MTRALGLLAMWVYVGASCGDSSEPNHTCDASPLVCDQCAYVAGAIDSCAAQLTCTPAPTDTILTACEATPLTPTQFDAFKTWSCGDVASIYCDTSPGTPCPSGWPTWLCR